ncbi:hypothetical protein V8F20_001865 [Naviculisporaceae sp. PSN 640]
MIFTPITTVLATIAALSGMVTGLPTDAASTVVQRDPCKTTPGEYWQCLSDCLYKICKTGDAPCIQSCDYGCGVKWVPGFPGCTPEPW